MTTLKTLMLALVASSLTHEAARVDLASLDKTSPPQVVSFELGPGTPIPILDGPPISDPVKLNIVNSDSSSSTSDVRLTNISSATLEIPISRDGKEAYNRCPGRRLLDAVLFMTNRADSNQQEMQIGETYGCKSFLGSTIVLSPGDWITFTGIKGLRNTHFSFVAYSLVLVEYSGDLIRPHSKNTGLLYASTRTNKP